MTSLRLGTRRSELAMTQSTWVADRLRALGHEVEIVEIVTEGDVNRAHLTQIGGTGVFAAAIRTALLEGRVDFAVHSLKDLPVEPHPGLVVAAVPPREVSADVLVSAGDVALADLPPGSVVGTGSPRRASQLRAARPDLVVEPIRGNVGTRLARVGAGVDAVVLAAAGLTRLGRLEVATEVFDPDVMLPAPGQGALALECRADDEPVVAALAALDDPDTRLAVTAERALLAALEAGCTAPVGALARVTAATDDTDDADDNGDAGAAEALARVGGARRALVLDAYAGSDDAAIALRRRGIIDPVPDVVREKESGGSSDRRARRDRADAALAAADELGRRVARELLAGGAGAIPATMRERSAADGPAPPEAVPPDPHPTNEQE